MTINFGGNIYDDAGNAVSGASVKLLETGTTTQEGSTVTTDSDGRWDFSETDQDRYDVEITKGSSVRRIKWSDEISLQEIDVRNNAAAGTPAATFTNLTDAVANQVAVFSGANATRADGDEIYLSFKLADSAGNLDEFARITAEATDVTNGSEDGQIRFGVAVAGTLTDVFTINSSTGGAATISYEVDSFTIKGGEGEAGVLYLFADQGDDAGDEWKVNVADGGVLTIGNDIASAGTYVTMLTITPHATTASSSVAIAGDATVGDDLSLTSDSSVFNMGAGNDFTITHDGTTGATLAGNPITITSAAASTWSTSSGALTITSGAALNLNPTSGSAILLDGTISVDAGVVTGATSITSTAFVGDITGDVTGNTSGSAATVTTAAQGNITSLGTLTALTVDDVAVNGKVVTMTGSSSDTAVFTAGTNGTLSIVTTDAGGAAANIQITADGTAELAGTTVTLDAGTDIYLDAAADINIPVDVGLKFADDGQKIESDGTDFTISSGAKLNLTPTSDVHIANGTGIVVGHTAQETISIGDGGTDLVPEVQVLGTAQADSSIMLAAFSTTATAAGAPLIALVKGGNATIGSHTVVTDGEELGNIIAYGDDGTDLEAVAAQIQFEVDGTPGTGDMPGRIIFATTADGAETATEKMRIAADGTVTLTSTAAGATGPTLNLFHDTGSASATGGQDTGDRLGVIDFLDTDGTIRGEINCALEGNTSQAGFHFRLAGDATNDKLYISRDGNATLLGTLTESSDERLKANVATLTGSLAKVKQMRGVSFTRNDLTDKTQTHLGLIAQELEPIAPELVSTGANGFKSVAYSQLASYLIEAIKELDTRIVALE